MPGSSKVSSRRPRKSIPEVTRRIADDSADNLKLVGRGWCKTWTLDSVLDRGLDSGLHFGLDFGLDIGLYFVRMAQKACQRSLYLCLSGCLWEPK